MKKRNFLILLILALTGFPLYVFAGTVIDGAQVETTNILNADQINMNPQEQTPTTYSEGSLYWDAISHTFRGYDGTYWQDFQMGSAIWGSITGTLSNQTDLQTALDEKVSQSGATMTGNYSLTGAIEIVNTTGQTITSSSPGQTMEIATTAEDENGFAIGAYSIGYSPAAEFMQSGPPLTQNSIMPVVDIRRMGDLGGFDYTGSILSLRDDTDATGSFIKTEKSGYTPVFEVTKDGELLLGGTGGHGLITLHGGTNELTAVGKLTLSSLNESIEVSASNGTDSSLYGQNIELTAGNAYIGSNAEGGWITFRAGAGDGTGLNGKYLFGGIAGSGIFDFESLTTEKTFTFPDVNGTIIVSNPDFYTVSEGYLAPVYLANEIATSDVAGYEGLNIETALNPGVTEQRLYNLSVNTKSKDGNSINIGILEGISSWVNHKGTGTVNEIYGMELGIFNESTGTIYNAYGLFIQNPSNAGTWVNNYGIYIQDQSGIGGTDSYNLYSAGASSENKFEGSVQAGSYKSSFGNAGLSGIYHFDATTSGNITSMTFENGILTAVTTLP